MHMHGCTCTGQLEAAVCACTRWGRRRRPYVRVRVLEPLDDRRGVGDDGVALELREELDGGEAHVVVGVAEHADDGGGLLLERRVPVCMPYT